MEDLEDEQPIIPNAFLVAEDDDPVANKSTATNEINPNFPVATASAFEQEKPDRRRLLWLALFFFLLAGVAIGVAVPLSNRGGSSPAGVLTSAPSLSPQPSAVPTGFPTMAPTASVEVTVVLQLDFAPEETAWNLICGSRTVFSVPAGTYDAQDDRVIVVREQVGLGADCNLLLTDTASNGITDGFIEVFFGEDITDDGAILARGPEPDEEFTDSLSLSFRIEAPPTPSPTVSSMPSISPEPSAASVLRIAITFVLDDFPQETSWTLQCDDETLRNVTAGTYTDDSASILEEFTVREGASCSFAVADTFGDGICCGSGNGFYRIVLGDNPDDESQIVAEGGDFGEAAGAAFTAVELFTAPPEVGDDICDAVCSDGSSVPPEFADVTIPDFGMTCGMLNAQVTAGLKDASECSLVIALGAVYCGCPTSIENPCNLCGDGSAIPLPLEPAALGVTCVEYMAFALGTTSADDELCGVNQATLGVYCGCDNPIASEDVCRVCGDERLLPDPEMPTNFDFEGELASCAIVELAANMERFMIGCEAIRAAFAPACCNTMAPSTSPAPSAIPQCTTTLNSIFNAEEAVIDDSVTRTYFLCPNTTFEIDTAFGPNDDPLNGLQLPLLFNHSNYEVLCGFDGRSENNCVLNGGLFQAGFSITSAEPPTNVLVQGVTFTNAAGSASVISSSRPGEATFRDCIFRVSLMYSLLPLSVTHFSLSIASFLVRFKDNSIDTVFLVAPGFLLGETRHSRTLMDHVAISDDLVFGDRRAQSTQAISKCISMHAYFR